MEAKCHQRSIFKLLSILLLTSMLLSSVSLSSVSTALAEGETPGTPTPVQPTDTATAEPPTPTDLGTDAATAEHPAPTDLGTDAPAPEMQATTEILAAPQILWVTYRSEELGFEVDYPADLTVAETVGESGPQQGVASDLRFGENIELLVRTPALEDDFVSQYWESAEAVTLEVGTPALLKEYETLAAAEGDALIFVTEYLIRRPEADYLVRYYGLRSGTPEELAQRALFTQMANSFRLRAGFNAPPTIEMLAASADGFNFFVNPPDGGTRAPWYTSYNARNPYLTGTAACYNKPYTQLQHTAEDWFRSAGTPVYAVANGRVIYIHPSTYPGNVIIVEHTLPSGTSNPWGGNIIYSVYAHVNSEVSTWQDVSKGQRIANVLSWPNNASNSHIHFEMRRYGDMTNILRCPANGAATWPGPGYSNTDVHPDTYGYTNPSGWIDSHRTISPPPPPPPSCSNSADQVAFFSDPNYSGSCSVKGIGDYTNPSAMGIPNDSLSSIRVGGNVKVTVCGNDNYGGTCETFSGDDSDLGNNSIGHDTASSAKVESRSAPSKPDLVPYPLPGRADPVMASSVTGTTTNGTLYAGMATYFDWGYGNTGNANASGTFYVDLYVDTQRFVHYPFGGLGAGSSGGFGDWSETWSQAGWHTVKLVVDPENAISESNEGNNVWTKSFYWEGPVGTTITFTSQGLYDGYVVESSEASGVGGGVNSTTTTFLIGDDALRRQMRSIVSFNTAGIPDNAVIKSAQLKMRLYGLYGFNPFYSLGRMWIDVKNGAFGTTSALEPMDFSAAATVNNAGSFGNTGAYGVYTADLSSVALPYINKTGLTQMRVRFWIDDDNDATADFLAYFSGNYAGATSHPALVITY
jgi:murein DD-endopeptidase MepM/ murein hydrolase activator NlpD